MKNKTKIIYPLICLLTAIIWGSGFPFQDMAGASADILDGFMFNGLRFFIAGIIVIPVFLVFEKESDIPKEQKKIKLKHTVFLGAASGAILAVSSALQQFGIQLTGESGKAGFITGLYLIIVPVATFVIFKQKASIFVWVAIPISVAGLYFLSVTNGFTIKTGDILVILCAFGYASQIIFIDRVGDKISAIRFSCTQFFAASIICLILGLCFGNTTLEGITTNIVPILYCGVFSAGAAYTLQIIGQKHTPPAVASLLFATEGLFATIFECIVDKRLPSAKIAIGCVLMLVAIILSQLPSSFSLQKEKVSKKK